MTDKNYKLTYFNIKGLAEPIRYIFAWANVPFEDNRIAKESWPAMKESMPFQKLPVLEVDGEIINQSMAIARFLGKSFGLATNDLLIEAKLESVIDNIRDCTPKVREEIMKKTPEAKKEADDALAFVFERLEKVTSEGYFYGSEPTWADIHFAGYADSLEDYKPGFLEAYPNMSRLVSNIRNNENIKKYLENRPAPAAH